MLSIPNLVTNAFKIKAIVKKIKVTRNTNGAGSCNTFQYKLKTGLPDLQNQTSMVVRDRFFSSPKCINSIFQLQGKVSFI